MKNETQRIPSYRIDRIVNDGITITMSVRNFEEMIAVFDHIARGEYVLINSAQAE